MSGSGGGGGYGYQAQAAAYIAAHILAKQPLHWIEHCAPDIPIAVAEETGEPGDDIRIELQAGSFVELQAKSGPLNEKRPILEATINLVRLLTEHDPAVQAALEKIKTIEPNWYKQFLPKPQFASMVSRHWLGINPVTKLTYQWLWDDLKRVA